VSLDHFFCQRNKVTTDQRLAHLVIYLKMEQSARTAFNNYLSKNTP